MPMNSIILKPGVNTQLTPSFNEAGISESQFIRNKDSLVEKLGGWVDFYPLTITSTIRDIHAWQGTGGSKYLAVGATASLSVIESGSLSDVTPETRASSFSPQFSVSSGSDVITVVDPGSSVSQYDIVYFNTPVAVGTTLISGAYPINTVGGSSDYTIISSGVSNTAVTSSGKLPVFTTVADSAVVTVNLPNNNYFNITGIFYPFTPATSVGGLSVDGDYQVRTILDSTEFTIVALTQATSVGTATMNSSLVSVTYYTAEGPPAASGGYGLGGYGLGGYGIGSAGATGGGAPVTATDWTMDNWGATLLTCPENGPVYEWSPDSGFTTSTVVAAAPFSNGGIFVSMPQQILVAWRSASSISRVQNNLLVRWSDAGDYTNWTSELTNSAGSFVIPTGSLLMGGIQGPTYGMVFTDIDAWIMQYVGGDVVFNFTKIGSGCGLAGKHAVGIIANDIYWCGTNNFYTVKGGGVSPLPCAVWDFIFQNINETYRERIVCASNSAFNEITWYFPSAASTGENDSYVKYNIKENTWDYGSLVRTAWQDVSPLGMPIGTDQTAIYQHEDGYNNTNVPMLPSFTTGWWTISEGNEMAFVDWVLPDMIFGTYDSDKGTVCEITFESIDYTGDTTPRTYGPYSFTKDTEYINTRIRGRFMRMSIATNDLDSFWRIGRIRYRWAPAGRR